MHTNAKSSGKHDSATNRLTRDDLLVVAHARPTVSACLEAFDTIRSPRVDRILPSADRDPASGSLKKPEGLAELVFLRVLLHGAANTSSSRHHSSPPSSAIGARSMTQDHRPWAFALRHNHNSD
jgi:hypothetical protein